MKKIIKLVMILFLINAGLKAQPAIGAGASTDWKVGGNTTNAFNVIGTFWTPGGIGATQSQMWFTTGAAAAQYRMAIFGGGTGVNDGRVAMGNNLPVGFTPSARLHLHQTAVGQQLYAYHYKYNGINNGHDHWNW